MAFQSAVCRDAISTAANGTVTSIAENTSRQCPFVIKAPPGWILQVSCSNLSPVESFQLMLKITGIIDYSRYEDFVFENRMYTATLDNQINLRSLLGDGDWIQCKWTTTLKNTTDFKSEIPLFKNVILILITFFSRSLQRWSGHIV